MTHTCGPHALVRARRAARRSRTDGAWRFACRLRQFGNLRTRRRADRLRRSPGSACLWRVRLWLRNQDLSGDSVNSRARCVSQKANWLAVS